MASGGSRGFHKTVGAQDEEQQTKSNRGKGDSDRKTQSAECWNLNFIIRSVGDCTDASSPARQAGRRDGGAHSDELMVCATGDAVHPVDVGHAERRQHEGEMDNHIPHQLVVIDVLGVHERLEQMDG